MIVRLEDPNGTYVCTAEILPYNDPPGVLLWGIRVFAIERGRTTIHGSLIYREAVALSISRSTFDEASV